MLALWPALIASLFLGAVMTFGDFLWAALHLPHRVVYGLAHGAVMCLCLGLAIGVRWRHPAAAALAGPVIGVLAAGLFYLLAPWLRWSAMVPAWMLFWILFALLQQRLRLLETIRMAVIRGVAAAMLSGLAFYAVSGMWTRPSPGTPNYIVHFVSWSFAFLPGFLALFWVVPRQQERM